MSAKAGEGLDARSKRNGGQDRVETGFDGRRKEPVRLLIIDPRQLPRACLEAALAATQDIVTVGAVANVDEAVAIVCDRATDAVLVNLAADQFDEAALSLTMRRLRDARGSAVVLVLKETIEPQHAVAAAFQGVRVLLDDAISLERVVQSIGFACAGWTIYPAFDYPRLLYGAARAREIYTPQAEPLFTRRQSQVLALLEKGATNKEIAIELGLRERTVKAHVKELMRRLNASNRTQVVAIASREKSA
jgi:DNA-binding NarL/FixJ family response regulator